MGNSCSTGQKKKGRRSETKGSSPLDNEHRSSVESLPYGRSSPTTTRGKDSGFATSETTTLPSGYDKSQPQLGIFEMSSQDTGTPKSPSTSIAVSTTVETSRTGHDTIAFSHLQQFPAVVQSLLLGRFEEPLPPCPVKQIFLYVIADFWDAQVERSAFMEKVYPNLRLKCAEKGYELNVVDLHWSFTGDCLDDHSFKELCLDTIRDIKGRGHLITLVFLDDVLDSPLLPKEITATDFRSVVGKLDSLEKKELFEKWYFLDENANPPSYILRLVSKHLPGILKESLDAKLEAIDQWRRETREMLESLNMTLGEKEKSKYLSTVLEDELRTTIFDSINKYCLWVQRRYTHHSKTEDSKEDDKNHHSVSLKETAALKLNSLKRRLNELLPASLKLIFRVKWHDGTINPDVVPEHEEYLNELCKIVKTELSIMILRVCDEDLKEESRHSYRGIENQLYTELVQQAASCKTILTSFTGRQELLTKLQEYVTSDTSHPIIIHGPRGCGKTALIAQASQLCSDWLPVAPVIIRFVGTTSESKTLEQILRSICEQGCALFCEHPSLACKSAWEPQEVLEIIMDKVTSQHPLIIFIDGLDQVASFSSRDLKWLPVELPKHVKLIISVQDETLEYKELKNNMLRQTEKIFMFLPGFSQEENISLVEEILQRKDRKITEIQHQFLQQCLDKCNLPISAELLACQSSEWTSSQGTDDLVIKWMPEDLFMDSVTELEKYLSGATIGFIIGLLVMAKHGLSDPEVLDIITCEKPLLEPLLHTLGASTPRYFPTLLWYQIKRKLFLFLNTSIVGSKCLISCKNSYRCLCEEYYHRMGVTTTSISVALSNYFQGIFQKVQEEVDSSKEMPLENVSNLLLDQPLFYNSYPNRRKLDELPFHYLQHLEDSWVKENFFFNTKWLHSKLQASDPYQVLEDIAIYQSRVPSDSDVLLLQKVIQLSSYALRYDGMQFLSQVYGRLFRFMTSSDASKFPCVGTLFHTASYPPVPSLLPLMPCLYEPNLSEEHYIQEISDVNIESSFSGFHWLKNDQTRVISFSTKTGEIIIWNIYEDTPVRTIKGLTQPKNIKMLDSSRALVLCNRELKVYDLNEGKLVVKLKGLMNQKMPYFGLHSAKYAVTLSRNRMYVNMMNLETGDLDTTFKVGEDRFLNSLLVSSNGNLCVCGDETQPFPLLVWDLTNRKLLHDLRIPRHEFFTRLLAITSDGRYVACVCRELNDSGPSFIVVYDLESGTLFKKLKPEHHTCSITISSPGGCVVNGLENTWIVVWDLASGGRRSTLRGHSAPADTLKMDDTGTLCLSFDSSGRDKSIRVWDVAKSQCLAVFTSDLGISCCEFSPDGVAVVMGLKGKGKLVTLLLCHCCTIEDKKKEVLEFGDPKNKGKIFDVSEK
ncbi:NACHT domain- and WD repeat-containing protein 1-like [Tachypleus tridentatus]|uniref:NACHT domain- and WD repeat-containing protein 1-like n=1 Tax=Tachypleus tridentatus TaxID=6853 RepID=UPI003FCF204F